LENEFKELTSERYLRDDSATVKTTAYLPYCGGNPHPFWCRGI